MRATKFFFIIFLLIITLQISLSYTPVSKNDILFVLNDNYIPVSKEDITFVLSDVGITNSCTYSSGDWTINGSDGCNITSNIDMGGHIVYVLGEGDLNLYANISNFSQVYLDGYVVNGLNITCKEGCFQW